MTLSRISNNISVDIREGVTYDISHEAKAPISAETPTGAVITTAEAAMTCKPIIGVLAVDLKEIHGDLPQLPDRM